MNQVDLDGRMIVLLRDLPTVRKNNIICSGLGSFDGEEFTVECEDGLNYKLTEDLVDSAMPITGKFIKMYKNADYYIICGNQF